MAEELKQSEVGSNAGILGRALAEESFLNQNTSSDFVPNLSKELVTQSQVQKQIKNEQTVSGVDVLGQGGLGNIFG